MPEDNRNWFITERSEALASLLLTSRPDLSVRRDKQENGIDFVVALREAEDVPPTKLFFVQVKGTLSSDQVERAENVKQLFKHGTAFFLPVCVFLVNVRKNDAVYAWIAEPQVKAGSVALHFFEHPDFHPLDNAAVDQIVNRVRAWYDAMPHSTASNVS